MAQMIEPITNLDPERIRSNLEGIREHTGPDVEILAATKYVRADDMEALAEAGVVPNAALIVLARRRRPVR